MYRLGLVFAIILWLQRRPCLRLTHELSLGQLSTRVSARGAMWQPFNDAAAAGRHPVWNLRRTCMHDHFPFALTLQTIEFVTHSLICPHLTALLPTQIPNEKLTRHSMSMATLSLFISALLTCCVTLLSCLVCCSRSHTLTAIH